MYGFGAIGAIGFVDFIFAANSVNGILTHNMAAHWSSGNVVSSERA